MPPPVSHSRSSSAPNSGKLLLITSLQSAKPGTPKNRLKSTSGPLDLPRHHSQEPQMTRKRRIPDLPSLLYTHNPLDHRPNPFLPKPPSQLPSLTSAGLFKPPAAPTTKGFFTRTSSSNAHQ